MLLPSLNHRLHRHIRYLVDQFIREFDDGCGRVVRDFDGFTFEGFVLFTVGEEVGRAQGLGIDGLQGGAGHVGVGGWRAGFVALQGIEGDLGFYGVDELVLKHTVVAWVAGVFGHTGLRGVEVQGDREGTSNIGFDFHVQCPGRSFDEILRPHFLSDLTLEHVVLRIE